MPSRSFGRLGRVVCETENSIAGSRATTSRHIVVFAVPDGAATTTGNAWRGLTIRGPTFGATRSSGATGSTSRGSASRRAGSAGVRLLERLVALLGLESRRDRLGIDRGQDHVIAVHHDDRAGAPALGGVDQFIL